MNTQPISHSQRVDGSTGPTIARRLATAARIFMGLIFFIFGLNGFLNFIPQPSKPMPEGAVAFVTVLVGTHYLLILVAGTQFIVGMLLLSNRFVPLALALIAPVVVNILAFHAFLEPSGLGVAIVVVGLEGYLAWAYRKAFLSMLAMRAAPF